MTSRVATRGAGAGMGGGGHANNPAFMFQSDYQKNKWKAAVFVLTVTAVAQHGQSAPLTRQVPRVRPLRHLRVPLAAPGGSALPWGKRPGRWASGLCSGCSSGEPPPRPSISWPLTLQVGCGIPWFSVKFAQKKAGVDW